MSTRSERDSLGTVEVPAEALWGAQTQRAVDNFRISGQAMPTAFLRALARIKGAAARASQALGGLDETRAGAIAAVAEAIAGGEHAEAFPVEVFQTGSGTSSNMNMNEVIARLAGQRGVEVHPNDDVNRSQSSNDVVPSAIQLAATDRLMNALMPALAHLRAVIGERATALAEVAKTGRTHLMDAMPLTFGQELGTWDAQLAGCQAALRECLPRLAALPLGGTAIGTGINAADGFAERAVAELQRATGLPVSAADNRFEGIAGQQAALELAAKLAALAVVLGKIANDLRWMNSGPLAGLGEISLPALQPGSSIMPGKVNPVICEAVVMLAAQVQGCHLAVSLGAQGGNFQLNTMLPLIAHNLLPPIDWLAEGMRLLAEKAIAGFEVNRERIEQNLSRNPILVTALNPLIGYEKAAAIAKRAYREQRTVLEVALEDSGLDEATLKRALDPLKLTRGGEAGGE
ncbi:class II fumarate hydratase [Pseudomarimonas salicorniae]|uniref:Fumarate hydratase class II n=1 Tax=Pseudomarimonas salicorniae TaxID=2933270 RepID=A0ABT0GEX9_9GAMM|nr:class II fumarate hydratase [Lysobacter sp. CAU 1642]MCK7593106.1 class II fumarate hydratase [Lysobacter sp. CAU 1642]